MGLSSIVFTQWTHYFGTYNKHPVCFYDWLVPMWHWQEGHLCVSVCKIKRVLHCTDRACCILHILTSTTHSLSSHDTWRVEVNESYERSDNRSCSRERYFHKSTVGWKTKAYNLYLHWNYYLYCAKKVLLHEFTCFFQRY